jgi:hypothetical protein
MAQETLNFDRYLPEGQELKPFQHAGVAYAVYQNQDGKGTFIADEQGLGKTVQAIVAAKVHADIFKYEPKILIVCKNALKGNWEHEINMFAPEWDVQVLAGTRPYHMTSQVAVISFNLLGRWADALVAEGFTSLIIDESHVVKDPKTGQTKAALKIAADIRTRRGFVALLSGTPLLNRVVELVTQLQIIGRLEQVSPAPRKNDPTLRDWEYAFKFTFCAPKQNSYGKWEFKGGSKLNLLNTNMRDCCYVRRLRNEVLNLSETHRIHTPLSLNGALDRYWDIEKNFVAKDPRSFVIELLTALRQEVALAKIPAAVEWIEDFFAENPGKKLVVWGWHVEEQKGITNALNAAGIKAIYLKGAKDIEVAKKEFNQGDAQVIVCSLQAHREGHTLVGNGTNVTDSLFVSQPWHPGAVSQAEDRINRIGREAAAVFAHTLIVPGTTDTWLEDLIATKWDTFKAAANGTIATWEEDEMEQAVQARLAAHLLAKYGANRFPDGKPEDAI